MRLTIPDFSLVLMMGASGSGKSTFAVKHFLPTEIISSDRCRGFVADDEGDQSATSDAFDVLYYIAAKRLAARRLTVLDATNLRAEDRKHAVELARKYHALPVIFAFDIPEAVCTERNRSRPDRDFGAHVVRNHVQLLRRSLRGLQREGFRSVHVLNSPEAMATAEIVREPLFTEPEPDGASSLPIDVRHLGTAGPRVLLIHGGVQGSLGGGPATFTRQDALAESSWRVDSVSRPGFGPSPSRGPDDMDKDAVWIAKMFGGGTNVIAHSWGAAEALLAAARRPAQVQSLILVEPALQNLLAGDPVLRDDPVARSAADKFRQIALSANTPGEYSVGFAASVAGAKPALDPNSETAKFAGCALLRANMATASEMRAAAETVAREDIPVLVITGGWSPFFDAVGEAAARATQGRHVIVKSPGHMVQLESSADFNATVEAFMLEADVKRPAK